MSLEEAFGDWLKVIDTRELGTLVNTINTLYKKHTCVPEYKNIFKVFQVTPFNKLKVVMLFQDPYPQKGIATGIALANKANTVKLSPSLNKVKEAVLDLESWHNIRTFDPTLESWCAQGVLMLNTALTVEIGKPGSHASYWRAFISHLLSRLSLETPGLIYVLWGTEAKSFERYITSAARVLKMMHPAYYVRTDSTIPPKFFIELKRLVKYYWAEDINFYT